MSYNAVHAFYAGDARPLALVLGTNEIASAVAVALQRAQYSVVLCNDPFPPVIRRGMAFHDALFGDQTIVNGIRGERAESMVEIARAIIKLDSVAVTPLKLTDVITMRRPDILIDARMQKHRITPDYRGIVRLTVGLGPNFNAGVNCDIAIETHPARVGTVIREGQTEAADGKARDLGSAGKERFVYSHRSGLWHTPVDIGMRVFKGFVLGHLDGVPVHAGIDGFLRGVARDATPIPAGVKIVEIDPRGRRAKWTGVDERGCVIANAVLEAIEMHAASPRVLEAAGAPSFH
jgi:xanthine dehydrogenase accessory factor